MEIVRPHHLVKALYANSLSRLGLHEKQPFILRMAG
jgi:hypothetical protein